MFGKTLSGNKASKHLTKLKSKPQYVWIKKLNSQTAQEVLQRIEKGYQKFFQDLKKRKKTSAPKFRPWRKYRSITFKQTGYKLFGNNQIKIGKKTFKFFKSRDIEGNIKTLTVKRDAVGDFFVVFSCEIENSSLKLRDKTGKMAAFDFGLKTFLIDQDNNKIEAPLFLAKSLKELKFKSKKFSRKKKGSNNRKKARVVLSRFHRKVGNQRTDFHFKLAKKLCEENDVLFFEDLTMTGMHRLWGRKVSDLANADFMTILEYQAAKSGSIVHKIDKWFPSTKTCSNCLKVREEKLELSERMWVCACGAAHNRDHNAAKNIFREGASSLGLCASKTYLFNRKEAGSNSRIPRL
jgi:putative transposase